MGLFPSHPVPLKNLDGFEAWVVYPSHPVPLLRPGRPTKHGFFSFCPVPLWGRGALRAWVFPFCPVNARSQVLPVCSSREQRVVSLSLGLSPWIEAPLDAVWLFSQESNKKITSDTDLLYSWELPNGVRWETTWLKAQIQRRNRLYTQGGGKKRKRKKRI